MPAFAIPWIEQLSLQVTELNEDHHHILDKVNSLLTALSLQDPATIMLACNALHVEAVAHFAEEEMRMREAAYPEFKTHCEHHQRLLERLSALQFQVTTAGHSFAMRDTFPFLFLETWLFPHLLNDDKQLSEFLAKRKAETPARAESLVRNVTDADLPQTYWNESANPDVSATPRDRRQPVLSRRLADRRQTRSGTPSAQAFVH